MKVNIRIIILVLVVLAVGVIFVIPYLNPGQEGESQFATTPDPAGKFAGAAEAGKPIFLEFYGVT